MDDERDIELRGKIHEAAAFLEQRSDVGLDHRRLDLQRMKRIFLPQPAQMFNLRRGLPERVQNNHGQGFSAEVGVKHVNLLEHPFILERIRDPFGTAGLQFPPAHGRDVEGEIGDHRKHDPAVDTAMTSLRYQRRQVLSIRDYSRSRKNTGQRPDDCGNR